MAATIDQIESALTAPWRATDYAPEPGTGEWTGTPLEYVSLENSGFSPSHDVPNDTSWMEVTTSAGQQRATDIAAVDFTGSPTLTIAAHVPLNMGKKMARDLLDAAADMYRGRELSAGTSHLRLRAVSSPVPLPADGYYRAAVQLSFDLY